ncbi:MAG TPA: hypothetical protein VMF13_01980 [Luteitalea sp.]|nr:hypothetical protein [Luteitalea sp.]
MRTAVGSRQWAVDARQPAVARRSSAFGAARCRAGQTPTEYLMIAGIMTAIGILVLLWMYQPWRQTTQDITDCVRQDDCDAVGAK